MLLTGNRSLSRQRIKSIMAEVDEYRDYKKSVKLGDLPTTRGAYAFFLVPAYDTGLAQLPYDLPSSTFERDRWLRYSTRAETMWANAIGIAATKLQALAYNVSGDVALRNRRAQQLLLHADGGNGWVTFIGKIARDYLTTNNGVFIEIERYAKGPGARIKGLHHLDSLRCRRTGDPEIPVIYRDLLGVEHELRYHQVVMMSSGLADSRAEAYGQGECAAERAWRTIAKLAAIERYVFEKVSGRRPLALHFVGGVPTQQIEDVIAGSQADATSRGYTSYMGAALSGVLSDKPPTLVTVPLAELPDGFDAEQERNDGYLRYANAIGMDLQDLQPLSGQGLGTGTQSVILSEKAAGKGLAAFRQDFIHAINELVLDDKTTFAFSENDLRDQKDKAEISKLRADTRKTMIEAGEITPAQSLQMAVDADDAPREFLPSDETSFDDLSDTEKPVVPDGEDVGETEDLTVDPMLAGDAEAEIVASLKEARDAGRLFEREEGEARELYEEVTGD